MNCIYKISCKDLTKTKCYIGSTSHFNKRIIYHKYACKNYVDLPLYHYINLYGGFDNCWLTAVIDNSSTSTKLKIQYTAEQRA